MSDNILQRFRDKFIEEAITLLDRLEKDLLELEKTPDDKELLESAFRAMHTIKGVSGMYGFDYIAEFTHVLENIYQSLRDKKTVFTKEISTVSFNSIDHIRKLLDDEKLTVDANKKRHKDLMAKINKFVQHPGKTAEPKVKEEITEDVKTKQSWYIILHTNEQIFFRGVSLTNIFKELSVLGEYHIQQIPVLSNVETDAWGVVLVSDCSLDEIQEVFMFIEDDCQIFKITADNVFQIEPSKKEKVAIAGETAVPEPSIMDLVESPDKYLSSAQETLAETTEGDANKTSVFRHQMKRISVDAEKLDHLMYLVSELITVNSQLLLATKSKHYEELRPFVENVDNLSKKFRNNALEIRLVPLSDLALRFQRLTRDLSIQLQKKIEFATEGIDTELDKNTIDAIAEPLMHIIRNSIDHGIEMPEQRLDRNKAETGTIRLSASHSGNYVFIKVEDDGQGIDNEKVRLKAVDRGILKPTDKPTNKEIYDIIFMPGFSTANSLTEVSGRGVGMDVVKKKITDLRGEIIIDSEKGKGTSFTLKLSQSMAITDTLLFRVQNSYFITSISEIEICDQVEIEDLDKRRHTNTIPYNNDLIPFIDLRELLHLPGEYGEKTKSIIVRKGEHLMALLTDAIIGEHQAVLKPIGKSLDDDSYLSSVSQLGDGNLAFLIDTTILEKKLYTSTLIKE